VGGGPSQAGVGGITTVGGGGKKGINLGGKRLGWVGKSGGYKGHTEEDTTLSCSRVISRKRGIVEGQEVYVYRKKKQGPEIS